jgi:hypothetical protein
MTRTRKCIICGK